MVLATISIDCTVQELECTPCLTWYLCKLARGMYYDYKPVIVLSIKESSDGVFEGL